MTGQSGRVGFLQTLILLASLLASASQGFASGDGGGSARLNAGPVIDVWYGSEQTFGGIGVPQRWVDILGNVSGPNPIISLTYSLNGTGPFSISQGPDTRRLSRQGDFDVQLSTTSLLPGYNSVTIAATDNFQLTTTYVVTVWWITGNSWRRNYTTSWGSPTSLMDSAQVVDGKWGIIGGGAKVVDPGYDRIIAIGDTTWDDYEITAQITVHGIDSTAQAFGPIGGGPLLGFLMRWKGHTNSPTFTPPITQPLSGYLPYGAIGALHWRTGFGSTDPNRWEIIGNDLALRAQSTGATLNYGVTYNFKMMVQTIAGQGGNYSFKVWENGTDEPYNWLMTGQETLADPQKGSVLIVANYVVCTIGNVTVVPVGSVTTPLLVSPSNGAIDESSSPTLIWHQVQAASSYHLQVSTDPSFATGIAYDNQNVQDTVQMVPGLANATTFYWHVAAKNDIGTSAFSSVWSFTTDLSAPTQVYPPTHSVGLPANLAVRWNRVLGASSYHLQVAADAGFAGLVYNDSSITDTVKVPTGLLEGRTYYWRVNSKDGGSPSGYSPVWDFTTVVAPPLLASPSNGATSQSSTLALRWHPSFGASSYHIQAGTDPTFATGLLVNDSTIVDTFRVVSGLQSATTFYWRVSAKSNGVKGSFSSVWSFGTTLPAPLLASPANASTGGPLAMPFFWRPVTGAATYRLQLGTDSTFTTGMIKNDSTITDTSRIVNGLAYKTRYFWRVSAKSVAGAGPFSATWSFTTTAQLPLQVVLVRPSNGGSVCADSAVFVWKRGGANVNRYWIEIAFDSLFTFRSIDSTVTDTIKSVVHQLIAGRTYWWKVRAGNPDGWGPYSDQRSFVAIVDCSTDAVPLADDVPHEYALSQNYPNPFNPSTRIEFSLSKESYVRLEVFNMLGERVAVMVDERRPAGRYTEQFDASGLASGLYFYRMLANDVSFTKKMMLLK